MKIEYDKFYTKKDVAKYCISLVDLTQYDLIIEPSAGNGSFSSQLDCISYDIEPECDGIIKMDFFDVEKPICKSLLIIGNPPFGKRSILAKKFIKKCIDIGAKTIAFILPDTFKKFSMQKIFPKEWKLVTIYKIEDNHFTANGIDYYVPCSFFVWSIIIDKPDLRENDIQVCDDFVFLKRGDISADFTINGNSGKIKNVSDVTNPKAEHYIRANDNVKKILSSIKWDFNSSVNGGIAWIGQRDIIKKYLEIKNCKKT